MTQLHQIKEFSCAGKQLDQSLNEDFLYIGDELVAVIDGATAKSPLDWDGETSGQFAGRCLWGAMSLLDASLTPREAVDYLTQSLSHAYIACGRKELVTVESHHRPTAAIIVLNSLRREIWMVGDCHALLNGQHIDTSKLIDTVNANARALFIESALLQGKRIEDFLENDLGRKFVWPMVVSQTLFQNKPETGEFWFSVLDGFPVPDQGIRVISLDDTAQRIVLASDGYPSLSETLGESEQYVKKLIAEDPLCFRKNKSVKGVTPGHLSFDDRTFVSINVPVKPRLR